MESQEQLSNTVVSVLYVIFLILSVIMLVNMLVALLTNTYDKVEVNKELCPMKAYMNNFSVLIQWLGDIQLSVMKIPQAKHSD